MTGVSSVPPSVSNWLFETLPLSTLLYILHLIGVSAMRKAKDCTQSFTTAEENPINTVKGPFCEKAIFSLAC